jgi:uncharacterized coiled-coil DUF342 family protein
MINQYSSSPERLASWFLESRNNWKKRAKSQQQDLRKADIKIRDLRKSRDDWKAKAKEYQDRIKELEEEKKLLQKKGKYP